MCLPAPKDYLDIGHDCEAYLWYYAHGRFHVSDLTPSYHASGLTHSKVFPLGSQGDRRAGGRIDPTRKRISVAVVDPHEDATMERILAWLDRRPEYAEYEVWKCPRYAGKYELIRPPLVHLA